ncbi:hypothetical protein [Actinacidiphila glaucinigra]|nr:hypothetical protein [Actinacidiphila glaucinigra]
MESTESFDHRDSVEPWQVEPPHEEPGGGVECVVMASILPNAAAVHVT